MSRKPIELSMQNRCTRYLECNPKFSLVLGSSKIGKLIKHFDSLTCFFCITNLFNIASTRHLLTIGANLISLAETNLSLAYRLAFVMSVCDGQNAKC